MDEYNVDIEKMVNAMAQVASYGDTVSSASSYLGQSSFGDRVKNIGADTLSTRSKCITTNVLGKNGTSNASNLFAHLENLKQLIIKNDKDAAMRFMLAEGNMDPILADRLSKMKNSLDEFSENPEAGFELWLSQNSYSKEDFFTDMAKQWGCKNAEEAYQMFVAVIIAECNKSKDDALSCVSVALNRCERNNWSSQHGTNPFDQMFYGNGNQYETVVNGRYLKYLPSAVGMDKVNENLAAYGTDYETLYNVVTTAVEGGLRNNDYTGFRAASLGGEHLAAYQSDFRYENPDIDRAEAEAARAARKGTIYDLSGDNKKGLTTGTQTTGEWINGQYVTKSATSTPVEAPAEAGTKTGTGSQQGTQTSTSNPGTSSNYNPTPASTSSGQQTTNSGSYGQESYKPSGTPSPSSTSSYKPQPSSTTQVTSNTPQLIQNNNVVPEQQTPIQQQTSTQQQTPVPQPQPSPQQQTNNYYVDGPSGSYGGETSYISEDNPQPLEVVEEPMQDTSTLETMEEVDYSTLGFEEPTVVVEDQSVEVNETPIVSEIPVVEPAPETSGIKTGPLVVGSLAALGAAGAVAYGVHKLNENKDSEYEDDEEDLNDSTPQYTFDDAESGNY